MKQNLITMKTIMLLAAFIWPAISVSGQPWTENFDTQSSNSYTTGVITINGLDWEFSDAGNFSYANQQMGSYAVTINDDKTGAFLKTPELNSCGTVSFKYAFINGTATNVFILQKSTDGSTWTDLETHTLGASADLTYQTYSFDVNDASSSLYIRILSDNQDAHLFIEDFSVTVYTGTVDPEPSDHVTAFAATADDASSISLSWADNDGTQPADGFLIKASTTNYADITAPSDEAEEADDTDLSDGNGVVKVAHGVEAYDWTGLTEETTYYFKIYPYTNTGSDIDYKTDGTVPQADATTGSAPAAPDLIISEVADPDDEYTGRFVELYNVGTTTIDFENTTVYAAKQSNGNNYSSTQLTGTLAPGETYTIANASNFAGFYGFNPDLDYGSFDGNGDDGYFLFVGGDETSGILFDAYGVVDVNGSGEAWDYENSRAVRNSAVTAPNATWTDSEWTIAAANVADMTANAHEDHTTFSGLTDNTWNTAGNWSGGVVPSSTSIITIPTGKTINIAAKKATADCFNLKVEPTAAITIDGTLNVDNDITIMSDATGTGSLIDNGTLNVTGTAKAELYLATNPTDTENWHYVSIPVDAANSDVFDPATTGNELFYWDESADNYQEITDNTTALTVGEGYAVNQAAARTVTISGAFNTGSLTLSGMTNTSGNTYNGFHLIGNPYPSAIDMQATSGWDPSNLTGTAWYRTDGNFATFNWTTGGAVNDGTPQIPAMQAIWVRVSDESTGSVDLTNDARVHHTSNLFKAEENNFLRFEVTRDGITDETAIGIYEDAKVGYDHTDSDKMFATSDQYPQIFTFAGNKEVAINGLPASACINMNMPLGFKTEYSGEFTLTAASIEEFNVNYNVYIKDNQTGALVDLRSENSYTFNSEIADGSDRFEIIISKSANDIQTVENGMNIYTSNNQVFVNTQEAIQGTMTIFDISGKAVMSENVNISGTKTFELNQPAGVYMVNIKSDNKNVTEKVVIR